MTIARPPMPRNLPAEAKAEWRRVVPELEEIGLLATIDRGVLIRYCTAWADWFELQGLLERSGKLIRGQKGNFVRNPLWFMKQDAEQTVAELGKQLGLTPVAGCAPASSTTGPRRRKRNATGPQALRNTAR